jgi:hypothetical protein
VRRALLTATLIWLALDIGHAIDHTRQGRDLATEVYTVGMTGWVATAVLLVLIVRGYRLAPLLATLSGAAVVLGFLAVHIAPEWSAFSDPYGDFDPDAVSWALVALPMLAGLNLAITGARWVRQPLPAPASPPQPG